MKCNSLRAWLYGNAMSYETFICFYVSEAKPLCFSLCSLVFDDVEHVEDTTFKMFVTQISNYLFVICFQLMFYKTLRYPLARAFTSILTMWFQVLGIPTNFAGPLYWSFWACTAVSKFEMCSYKNHRHSEYCSKLFWRHSRHSSCF